MVRDKSFPLRDPAMQTRDCAPESILCKFSRSFCHYQFSIVRPISFSKPSGIQQLRCFIYRNNDPNNVRQGGRNLQFLGRVSVVINTQTVTTCRQKVVTSQILGKAHIRLQRELEPKSLHIRHKARSPERWGGRGEGKLEGSRKWVGRKLRGLEPTVAIAGLHTPSEGSPGPLRAAVTSAFGNAVPFDSRHHPTIQLGFGT